MTTKNRNKEKGQVMLLSVLLISSAVLGAATLAGILVLFQLRQTADAQTSARAVFAADAGIERSLYEKYHGTHIGCGAGAPPIESEAEVFTIDPAISYIVSFEKDCTVGISAGRSGRSARAFRIFYLGIENFGGQFRN